LHGARSGIVPTSMRADDVPPTTGAITVGMRAAISPLPSGAPAIRVPAMTHNGMLAVSGN